MIAAIGLDSLGHHAPRVGAVIGFRQAETANHLAGGKTRQEALLLLFGAEGVDRMHHKRGLDGHRRTVAGIHSLDFISREAVGHMVDAGAPIFLGNGRAEKAEFAHLAHYIGVEGLVSEIGNHPWQQNVTRKGARAVTYHAFVIAELLIKEQRVIP